MRHWLFTEYFRNLDDNPSYSCDFFSFLIEYQAIGLEISICDKETNCMVQLGKKDHSQVLDITQYTTNSRTCSVSKDYVRSVISESL